MCTHYVVTQYGGTNWGVTIYIVPTDIVLPSAEVPRVVLPTLVPTLVPTMVLSSEVWLLSVVVPTGSSCCPQTGFPISGLHAVTRPSPPLVCSSALRPQDSITRPFLLLEPSWLVASHLLLLLLLQLMLLFLLCW